MVHSAFGSLRQVWACIGHGKCHTGLSLCGGMDIKSRLIASHLALSEVEISSHPSFRGVVLQLLSRIESFSCCSVIHFMKEHRIDYKTKNFNLSVRIGILNHCGAWTIARFPVDHLVSSCHENAMLINWSSDFDKSLAMQCVTECTNEWYGVILLASVSINRQRANGESLL